MYQSLHLSVNRRQCVSCRWKNYVLRKFVWKNCLIIAGYSWDGKFPAAQNRTSETSHGRWATEIGDCSLGRITVVIHPQNRYVRRESFCENPEKG